MTGIPSAAIARVPAEATTFTGRWVRIAWGRAAYPIVEPFSHAGRYVNDVTDSGPDLARWIYGDAKYDRLVAVKRAWDPDNTFRVNQNIAP